MQYDFSFTMLCPSIKFPLFRIDFGQSQSGGRASSKQYWAKGTGFGTGSTSSGWDIEQALVKQKNEEEHITSILQVGPRFVINNIDFLQVPHKVPFHYTGIPRKSKLIKIQINYMLWSFTERNMSNDYIMEHE